MSDKVPAKYRITERKVTGPRGLAYVLELTLVEPELKMAEQGPQVSNPQSWNQERQVYEVPLANTQYFRHPQMREVALAEGLRQLAQAMGKAADQVEWEKVA